MSFITLDNISQMPQEEQDLFYGPQALLLQCLWDQVSVCIKLTETQSMIGKIRSFDREYNISLTEARLILYDEITDGTLNEHVGDISLTGEQVQVVIRNEKVTETSPYFLKDIVISSQKLKNKESNK